MLGELPVLGEQLARAAALGGALVPLDLERVAPLLGGPEALAEDRHPGGNLDHVDHPAHLAGGARVEAPDRAAEARRPGDHGGEHPRQLDVGGELGPAVALLRDVDPRHVGADQPEAPRLLELDRLRRRDRRRRRRELAEGGGAPRRVGEAAAVDGDLRRRHLPLAGGGGDQHRPRRGPGLAQLLPGVGDRGAAAGALDRPKNRFL